MCKFCGWFGASRVTARNKDLERLSRCSSDVFSDPYQLDVIDCEAGEVGAWRQSVRGAACDCGLAENVLLRRLLHQRPHPLLCLLARTTMRRLCCGALFKRSSV